MIAAAIVYAVARHVCRRLQRLRRLQVRFGPVTLTVRRWATVTDLPARCHPPAS